MVSKKLIIIGFVLTLIILIISFGYKYSSPTITTTKTQTSDQIPDNSHPLINQQIGCNGDWTIEFEKRKQGSIGYHPPDLYLGVYDNKLNLDSDTQSFNLLDESNGNKLNISNYATLKGNQTYKAVYSPRPINLKNYMEKVEYHPVEIIINGEGFYFFENEPYLAMLSTQKFTQDAAVKKESCFDDGKRNIYFLPYGYLDGQQFNTKTIEYEEANHNQISFRKLTPQYCSVYSFLTTSKDVFQICLSKKLSSTSMQYLIVGVSLNKVEKSGELPKTQYWFSPAMITYFEDIVASGVVNNFFNLNIDVIQNKSGSFYLFTGTKTLMIKPDEDGFLQLTDIPDNLPNNLRYFVSYPDYYSDIDDQIPYLFLSYYSEDKDLQRNTPLGGIFDINKGRLLNVDYQTCVIETPEMFYNSTLDPFTSGPYKTMNYQLISSRHLRVYQSSSNAGAVREEGSVDIYFENDTVFCKGTIDGTVKY